jgi:hypothetical protein
MKRRFELKKKELLVNFVNLQIWQRSNEKVQFRNEKGNTRWPK